MNTETTELWNLSYSSLRRDQVLGLLKLGLEPDDDGDMPADLEAWSGAAISFRRIVCSADSDIVRTLLPPQQKTSDQEASNPAPEGTRSRLGGSERLRI
jgi:hypothetical protein